MTGFLDNSRDSYIDFLAEANSELTVEVAGLWSALSAIRKSAGYNDSEKAEWLDHFFPKNHGERPPFDLTDPRYEVG